MKQYCDLLKQVLDSGERRGDRTGEGTTSLFGSHFRHAMDIHGFPLLTTKAMWFRGIVEELLFFLRGETDSKKLEALKVRIWSGNTSREWLDQVGLTAYPEGAIGPTYGFNWRNWGGTYEASMSTNADGEVERSIFTLLDGVDQLANVVEQIKHNPMSRRLVVSAWDAGRLDEAALPPCHMIYQFYVEGGGGLSLKWFQRSVDMCLGLPFNLASYALLLEIVANICDLTPADLIFSGGDTHVYEHHVQDARVQLERKPIHLPKLLIVENDGEIPKKLHSLEDAEKLTFENFKLVGYKSHPAIKYKMAI